MDVPQISDVTIRPPAGGKAPIGVEFCADVSFQFPELASGATLSWDIDGNPGRDVDVPNNQCANFTYEDCESGVIEIEVTPQDRFGRTGQTITRSIQIVCNEIPVVSCIVTKNSLPPTGKPGDQMQFFITGFDPDQVDPDLDDANGLTRFEVDFEGDGEFDMTHAANLQALPLNHTYTLAGAFRPIVRGYDPDGDFGDTSCGLVTVFPETKPGGNLWLQGDTNAVWSGAAAGRPITSVFTGTERFGIGFASQVAPDRTMLLRTHRQAGNGDPRGFAGLANALFSINGSTRIIRLLHLENDVDGAPGGIGSLTCSGLQADQVATASFNGTHRLVRRLDTALMVSDVTALGGGFVLTEDDSCFDHVLPASGGALVASADPFGEDFEVSDFAVADAAVFGAVSVTGGDTGAQFGVVHYDLTETSGQPTCESSAAGCITHATSVTHVVARPYETMQQRLYTPYSMAGTYDAYGLARFVDQDAGDGLLWDNIQSYPASPTTWWYLSDAAIAVSSTFSGPPVSFTASALGVVLFSDNADMLHVYSYTGTGAAMSFSPRVSTVVPVPVDQLAIVDGHAVIRSAAAAVAGDRGVYLAPVTDLRVITQVETSRTALRQASNYSGPRDVAVVPGWGIWVADGAHGVYGIRTHDLEVSGYAGVTAVEAGLVSPALDVGLGGGIQRIAIPDDQRRGALATAHSAGIVDFTVASQNPFITPEIRMLRLSGEAFVDADMLHDATSGQDLYAFATSSRVALVRATSFDQALTEYVPPAGNQVQHIRIVLDPDPQNYGILSSFEQNSDGQTELFLQGFDAAGAQVMARRFRLPEELLGNDSTSSLGSRPPIFGRLTAKIDSTRTMDGLKGGPSRVCIEPFWGAMCPVNEDGDPLQFFTTLVGGVPYRTTVQDVPMIVRESLNTGILDITDVDGIALRRAYSPCFELPEAEHFSCTGEKKLTTAAAADPFFLFANGWAMFYVDMSNPLDPLLVSRSQLVGNTVNGMAGWVDGDDLLVAWYCAGSDANQCEANRRLLTLRVPGVAPQ